MDILGWLWWAVSTLLTGILLYGKELFTAILSTFPGAASHSAPVRPPHPPASSRSIRDASSPRA